MLYWLVVSKEMKSTPAIRIKIKKGIDKDIKDMDLHSEGSTIVRQIYSEIPKAATLPMIGRRLRSLPPVRSQTSSCL